MSKGIAPQTNTDYPAASPITKFKQTLSSVGMSFSIFRSYRRRVLSKANRIRSVTCVGKKYRLTCPRKQQKTCGFRSLSRSHNIISSKLANFGFRSLTFGWRHGARRQEPDKKSDAGTKILCQRQVDKRASVNASLGCTKALMILDSVDKKLRQPSGDQRIRQTEFLCRRSLL